MINRSGLWIKTNETTKPNTTEHLNYLALEFFHGINMRGVRNNPSVFQISGSGDKGKPLQCQGERSTEGWEKGPE